MRATFLSLLVLTALVGCGEDVGTRRGSPTVESPTLGGDSSSISQIHRNRGLNVLTAQTAASLITSNALPAGYRTVPLMAMDDEGSNGKNVRTRSGLGRPQTDCGLASGVSLGTRIADCSFFNSATAIWSGTSEGASGESTWRLVAKSGTQEVWQDVRTGILWSDVVATTNWCEAAGNNLQETGAATDCETFGKNFSCVGKEIMGLTGIIWRLPTRNDYLQADLDGLRFVLKETDTTGLWTATLDSLSPTRSEAWVYQQKQGTLEKDGLTDAHQVRCVGSAVTISI